MTKKAKQEILKLKIGGAAGQGVKSSGILFARFVSRSGCFVYNYIEYPSIVKGGHNVMQINISDEPVTGASNQTDILIALNEETIKFHQDEMPKGGIILYDGEKKFDLSGVPKHLEVCPVPFSKFAEDAGGKDLLINMVGLGAVAGLMSGELSVLKSLIEDEYGDKGEKIVNADMKAAELGYKYAQEHYSKLVTKVLAPKNTMDTAIPRMVINGNEAVALGAIAAGLQFAAIYPMSPISNILHYLALHQEKYNYVYKQPEDEIAAINMTLGASFAGARVMTATSGGGFALMAEGYGLAGIAELPIVIVEGMRGGPATGIPTWSEQGDLRFVLHAHQSDFPRIVLTPGDSEEIFYMTMEAFNLAEKYQTPVVVLIDKNLCENDQTYLFFDTSKYVVNRGKYNPTYIEDYERYKLSDDGISERSIPGVGNFFIANSDEHDLQGLSNEEIQNRNEQMTKRMTKLETCEKEDMVAPKLYGPKDADVTIVSWGSNKGQVLQALKDFDNVNFLHITWVNPFPTKAVTEVLKNAKHIINMECNYSAQMGGLIREKTGIEIQDNYLKFDGRPFFVEEIVERLNSVLKK